MKHLILSATVIALLAMTAFAGGDEVPAAVKEKFASLYPNVKKAKWEKENGNYEAEFEVNEVETSCVFDANANLLETETEIAVNTLPKAAAEYCAKNHAGKKISEAAKIVDSKNTPYFEAEVKGVGDLIFDASGNFVKKEVEQDDDDDDKDKEEKK